MEQQPLLPPKNKSKSKWRKAFELTLSSYRTDKSYWIPTILTGGIAFGFFYFLCLDEVEKKSH